MLYQLVRRWSRGCGARGLLLCPRARRAELNAEVDRQRADLRVGFGSSIVVNGWSDNACAHLGFCAVSDGLRGVSGFVGRIMSAATGVGRRAPSRVAAGPMRGSLLPWQRRGQGRCSSLEGGRRRSSGSSDRCRDGGWPGRRPGHQGGGRRRAVQRRVVGAAIAGLSSFGPVRRGDLLIMQNVDVVRRICGALNPVPVSRRTERGSASA